MPPKVLQQTSLDSTFKNVFYSFLNLYNPCCPYYHQIRDCKRLSGVSSCPKALWQCAFCQGILCVHAQGPSSVQGFKLVIKLFTAHQNHKTVLVICTHFIDKLNQRSHCKLAVSGVIKTNRSHPSASVCMRIMKDLIHNSQTNYIYTLRAFFDTSSNFHSRTIQEFKCINSQIFCLLNVIKVI